MNKATAFLMLANLAENCAEPGCESCKFVAIIARHRAVASGGSECVSSFVDHARDVVAKRKGTLAPTDAI